MTDTTASPQAPANPESQHHGTAADFARWRIRSRLTWWVGLLVVGGLPLVGHWWRGDRTSGCALDGQPLVADYQVEIALEDGPWKKFCNIRCGELFLEAHLDAHADVRVTDEATGRLLAARDATYVRSTVVTTPTTGNRIHVFADPEQAAAHAQRYGGAVLAADAAPFAAARRAAPKSGSRTGPRRGLDQQRLTSGANSGEYP